jgi:hypothetical protein
MSDSTGPSPRRSEAGRACERSLVVGRFTARAGSDDASEVGALCCRDRSAVGEFGRASAPARSRVAGEIMMFLPNQTVEATAPRRLTFVRHHFQNVVVSGGRALTGAVPHRSR